jgi:hypothetical protein
MLKDNIKLTGRLSIKKYDEKGKEVFKTEVPNLVVTSGKEFIAARLLSNAIDPIGYMSVGDDSSTAAVSQTALQNELARVATSSGLAVGTSSTFSATFPAGTGTGSLVEAGLFNTSSSSVKVFDADNDVDDGNDIISIASHGFATGDKVTYTDGGGTAITGLVDGGTYYVINIDGESLKLASSAVNAGLGTQINITGTSGTNHKLTYGIMLCRTTFPVITKSGSETVAISWVVTVG